MKKAVSLIAAATLCFICCAPGFAELLSGKYNSIQCHSQNDGLTEIYIVTEKDGRQVCEEKFLKPGTDLIFSYEEINPEPMVASGFDTQGRYYAYVACDLGSGYVETRYIVPENDEYDQSTAFFNSYKYTYYVIDPEGTALRKGPSLIYGVSAVIPQGATFTVEAFDTDAASPGYGYVSYEGKEGWVYIYDFAPKHSVCYCVDSSSYFAGRLEVLEDGVYLADINTADAGKYKRLSGDIPAGTELSYKYYCFLGGDNVAAYTGYGGKKGWVIFNAGTSTTRSSSVMPYVFDVAYLGEETKLYSKKGNLSSDTGRTVPADTPVNVQAFYAEINNNSRLFWINTDYGGENCWIAADDKTVIGLSMGLYAIAYVGTDTVNMYDTLDIGKGPSQVLYYGERMSLFSTIHYRGLDWYYVNTENGSGIIRNSEEAIRVFAPSGQHALRVDKDGRTILGISEYFDDPGVYTTAPAASEEETAAEPEKEFPAMNVAAGAGAALIVLAALAVSTVTTLRKQKKEKEEEDAG